MFPTPGTACKVPQTETCTYHGDGPCSQTNPDRIATCTDGTWGMIFPAIRCWPADAAAADSGGNDCAGPLSLDVYCDRPNSACSLSFAEMRQSYCDLGLNKSVSMQANRCGGRSLLTRVGLSMMRFDYDAAGKLRSVQSSDDQPFGPCQRFEYIYGQPCDLVDGSKPACDAAVLEDASI